MSDIPGGRVVRRRQCAWLTLDADKDFLHDARHREPVKRST